MRISVDDTTIQNYDFWDVYLDGALVKHAVAADTEQGWVDVMDMDVIGRHPFSDFSRIPRKRKNGKIELVNLATGTVVR